MPLIRFNYADVKPTTVNNKGLIKKQVAEIFINEKKKIDQIYYIFCSDYFLLEINKFFLQHDFFTDIITFDLSNTKDIIGEIYISVDRVRENAIIHRETYRSELLRVIFHGALHLCGYNDKRKSEITLMRQKEDYYLQLLEKKI